MNSENENFANNVKKPNKRHQARAFSMQALFQWHFSNETPEVLIQEFIVDHLREEKIDHNYFRSLVFGTLKNITTIDETMTPLLDRKISFLNPVELAVLRLAFYELQHCPEVPLKVVINEAIELAKEYGSADGYKFVNAVLNTFIKKT